MARYQDHDGDQMVEYVPSSLPPWHMWGNTIAVDVKASYEFGNVRNEPMSGQLVKVAHHRPDAWSFLFHARILEAPTLTDDVPSLIARLSVTWDVTTGLGRSAVMLPAFDRFSWEWRHSVGTPDRAPPVNQVMWSTSAMNPALSYEWIEGGAVDAIQLDQSTRRTMSSIVGQDIQVNVRAFLFMSGIHYGVEKTAKVEVSAYLTPNSGAPEMTTR